MGSRRRNIVVVALLVCAVALALGVQVRSSANEGALKLEGVWIARVTDVSKSPFPMGQYQRSYILVPSPSGRSAALHGTVDVGFPGNLIPHDSESPLLGQMTQTGHNTIAFDSEWFYVLSTRSPAITGIGRSWGEAERIAPDKLEVHHNFEIYGASADADGDGIIDAGATPLARFWVTTVDTRLR